MDKKNFIQLFVIHSRASTIESALFQAESSYKAIQASFPDAKTKTTKEGFETAKGRYIDGDKLKWFNNIWAAWNIEISAGSKGGKRTAGDAFLDQITDYNDAKTAYKSAKKHAEKERPALEAKNQTPPHFNKWLNDGRWETRITQCDDFDSTDVIKSESDEITEIKRKMAEADSIIKQFSAFEDASKTPENEQAIVTQAKERKKDLTAKLMQAVRDTA